jgi:medium-chain acyl-[acyl-carrier-protein] hydrolase
MKEDITVFNKYFNVGLFDLTAGGKSSILTIANFLQEGGMAHGQKIIESGYLKDEPYLGFVLTRLRIRMNRYPVYNENIRIHTWLSPISDNYIIRNFELFDDNEKCIGSAVNSAVPFDLQKRKMTTMPDGGRGLIVSEKEAPLPHVFEKIEAPEPPLFSGTIQAGYFDCDLYNHINNTHYLRWALQVLPKEILAGSFLREVDINFRAEANFTHRITSIAGSCKEGGKNEFLHRLIREDNRKRLILMKSIWEDTPCT